MNFQNPTSQSVVWVGCITLLGQFKKKTRLVKKRIISRKLTWLAGKSPSLKGDASSDGCFFYCHISFPGCHQCHLPKMRHVWNNNGRRSVVNGFIPIITPTYNRDRFRYVYKFSDFFNLPTLLNLVAGFSPTHLKNMRIRQIGSWNPKVPGLENQTYLSCHHLEIPWIILLRASRSGWFQVKPLHWGVSLQEHVFWVETRAVSRQKDIICSFLGSCFTCNKNPTQKQGCRFGPESSRQTLEFPKIRSGLVPSVADCFAKCIGDKSASLKSKAILKLY